MNTLLLLVFVLAIVVVLLSMLAAYWWDRWHEADAEVQRLQAAIKAGVVRIPVVEMPNAGESGKYSAIVYQTNFAPELVEREVVPYGGYHFYRE